MIDRENIRKRWTGGSRDTHETLRIILELTDEINRLNNTKAVKNHKHKKSK